MYVSSNTNNQHLSLSSTFKTYHCHPCNTLRASANSKQFIIASLGSIPNCHVFVDKMCVWNCLKTPKAVVFEMQFVLEILVVIASSCLLNLLPHVNITFCPLRWCINHKSLFISEQDIQVAFLLGKTQHLRGAIANSTPNRQFFHLPKMAYNVCMYDY